MIITFLIFDLCNLLGNIMPGTYWLKYENLTSVSVKFYWELSYLLVSLLESGFITGSRYQLMFLNGTVIESDITNIINFTLNNLNSGQWYFICVSLSTTDNISWPPDSCLNFKTKQGIFMLLFLNAYTYMFTKLSLQKTSLMCVFD